MYVRRINIPALLQTQMSVKMAMNYNFEWDSMKACDNRDKHDVTFDEATTVFGDSKALSIFDPDHSETEDRWITLGISEKGRLLIAIHAFLEEIKKYGE